MSFPQNVFVECAFANDYDESINAQTGYTDITPFVKNISGTLRGRQNETGRSEAGAIAIDLDNADGRFTPGRPASPYFPNVKSNRRLRIRGKNMLPANIASSGEKEKDATGFFCKLDPAFSTFVTEDPIALEGALENITGGGVWSIWGRVNTGATSAAGFQRVIQWYAPLELGVRLTHSAYIYGGASATGNVGHAARFEIIYYDEDDAYIDVSTVDNGVQFTVTGGATRYQFSHVPPSDAKYGICTISYKPGTTLASDALIVMSNPQTELPVNLSPNPSGYHDVIGWNVEGAADQSITVPSVITVVGLTNGTGTRAHTAVTTVANDWIVVQAIVQDDNSEDSNIDPSATGLTFSTVVDSGASSATLHTRVLTWAVKDTVGGSRTVTMTPQLGTKAYATRLSVVRNSSGPGSDGFVVGKQTLAMERQISNSIVFMAVGDIAATAVGTPTYVPTGSVSVTSQQVIGTASYFFGRLSNSGTLIPGVAETYGLSSPTVAKPVIGIMEMLPIVSGVENVGPQQDVTNQSIRVDWASTSIATDNARAGIDIPHLTPGFVYSASLEVKKVGTQSYLFSADDGQTGTTVSSTTFTTFNLTFTADSPEQTLSFFPSADVNFGDQIYFRRLNVQKGTTVPGLAPAYGSIADATAWEYPKPIFEGWTERWPAIVGPSSTKVTVSVVDRLKRVGTVELSNVLGEMLFLDNMDLIIPFNDSPTDSQGAVSQIGAWADVGHITTVKFQASKGDVGLSSFVLGVDGPTDETAVDLNPIAFALGYSLPIPYSADFTPPPPPKPKPAPGKTTTKPKPPVTRPKVTYTRVYNATWSRTFDSSGAVTFDDSPYDYQGFFSSDRGNNRSLIGFNYAQIKADLAGSTIKSIRLTMQNTHWYFNAGGTAVIGTHGYASKPASWSISNVTPDRVRSRAWPKGGRAAISLPLSIASEFKSGVIRGIALGPGPSTSLDYYGYFNGATQANRPSLTITFVK